MPWYGAYHCFYVMQQSCRERLMQLLQQHLIVSNFLAQHFRAENDKKHSCIIANMVASTFSNGTLIKLPSMNVL